MNADASEPGVLERLQRQILEFVHERGWDQLETPKNLAIALCVEGAELLEPFQWLQKGDKHELGESGLMHVQDEMADVLIYLLALAAKLDVDMERAVDRKLGLNRLKYPVGGGRTDMPSTDTSS